MKQGSCLKPEHIAVIMDGNGRWATARHLPRVLGYKQGLSATRLMVRLCAQAQIPYLTLFAFSSENWRRPRVEVNFLMDLFLRSLTQEIHKLHENQVVLKVIGDLGQLSEDLQGAIQKAENLTQSNTGLKLQVAINYGGQWDIVQASQKIAQAVANKELLPQNISVEMFNQHLSLAAYPNPDLLIRSGGEQRISNFLLWQLAYSELYFTSVLWPDFSKEDFEQALDFYAQRERRYGGLTSPSSAELLSRTIDA